MCLSNYGYELVEEYPISDIEKYQDKGRLHVFHKKGFECSVPNCNHVGSRLILCKDSGGGLHIRVFTDDLVMMNVDHRVAKSEGGTDSMDNLFPMCYPHNSKKGHYPLNRNNGISSPKLQLGKIHKRKKRYVKRWCKFVRKYAEFTLIDSSIISYKKIKTNELHKY